MLATNIASKYMPTPDTPTSSPANANIKTELLFISHEMKDEARTLGFRITGPDALTLEETKKNIAYARKYISFEVRLVPHFLFESPRSTLLDCGGPSYLDQYALNTCRFECQHRNDGCCHCPRDSNS